MKQQRENGFGILDMAKKECKNLWYKLNYSKKELLIKKATGSIAKAYRMFMVECEAKKRKEGK